MTQPQLLIPTIISDFRSDHHRFAIHRLPRPLHFDFSAHIQLKALNLLFHKPLRP